MRVAVAAAWRARVVLRSGREGAVWTLSDAQAIELERLWGGLRPASSPPRPNPGLRYAGLLVSQGPIEYLVHAAHVERRDDVASEHRLDTSRAIEALLLASAPVGSLPRPT